MRQEQPDEDDGRLMFSPDPNDPLPMRGHANDPSRSSAPTASGTPSDAGSSPSTPPRAPSATELQSRVSVALSLVPALALPAELPQLEQSPPGPNDTARWDSAEWAILRRGLDALAVLTGAFAVVALRAEPDRSVSALRRGQGEPRSVTGADAAALARLCEGPRRHMSLGSACAEFPGLSELMALGDVSGDVVVAPIPVAVGAPLGLVVGVAAETPSLDSLAPAIAALGAACGAGCQAIRLRRRIAEEAHARDAFISFAAHELRSPVTSTKGYAQLLTRQARKHPLPETMLHSIHAIEEQSGRMGDMVGELLDASRIRRGALDVMTQEMDVVPLIEKLIERMRARSETYQVELDMRESSLVGKWDPQRVEQIVRDLLENAMRFSPDSQRVLVTVERERDMAQITVRDEGIGVAPQERERIFDYLYRAPGAQRRNLGGLGLGLYVCRFLAERMGGRLDLLETRTAPPAGSSFRLSLPLLSS